MQPNVNEVVNLYKSINIISLSLISEKGGNSELLHNE